MTERLEPGDARLEAIVEDGWYRVEQHTVNLRDSTGGRVKVQRLVCRRGDRVAVLPYRISDATIVLTSQVRLPRFQVVPESGGISIELPGGLVEGGDIAGSARREVLEETGLCVGELVPLITLECCPWLVAERTHIFLAPLEELSPAGDQHGLQNAGELVDAHRMSLGAALVMVAGEEITDAKTIVALFALDRRLAGWESSVAQRAPAGDRLAEAFGWAVDIHRAQRRHNTCTPYISHLMMTSALVIEDGGDEDEAVAALLHDAVEDQGVSLAEIERRFGRRVADLVDDCTDVEEHEQRDQAGWRARKQRHAEQMLAMPEGALRILVADKIASLQALIDDITNLGVEILSSSERTADELLWNYEQVSAVLSAHGVRRGLTARLEHLVAEFRVLVSAASPRSPRDAEGGR